VEALENKVKVKRSYTSSARIDEENAPWIVDIGYIRRRETEYSKTMVLHCH